MNIKFFSLISMLNLVHAEAFGSEFFMNIFMICTVAAFFYLFFIKPQNKIQDEHNKMINDLKKGDRVLLTSGILGTVKKISEEDIRMEIAEQVVISVRKHSVQELANKKNNS